MSGWRGSRAGGSLPRLTWFSIRPGRIMGVMGDRMTLDSISLEPSPAVEAYKRDVDRTLIRENLKLSPSERLAKLISTLRFVEEVRRSGAAKR